MQSPTRARERALPWVLWAVVVLGAMLRWCWIGGTGDFAPHFDWAERILAGDLPGRDYVTTVVPGIHFLLAGLLSLVGDAVLWNQVLQHLAWAAGLAAGLALALRLAAGDEGLRRIAAGGLLVAVPLSFPLSTLGAPHNDAVTALCATAILLLAVGGPSHLGRALAAGLLAGLAVWFKQNAGLAFAFGLAGYLALGRLLWPAVFPSWRVPLGALAGILTGIALPALVQTLWLPLGEQAALYLQSAAGGKGGLATIVLRPLPRLILETQPMGSTRRIAEALLSLGLLLPLAFLLVRSWRPGRPSPAGAPSWIWLAGLTAALGLVWGVSLIPAPSLRAVGAALAGLLRQGSLHALGLVLAYMLCCTAALVLLWRLLTPWSARRRAAVCAATYPRALALGGVLLLLMGHATSSLYYTHSSLLIAAPVLTVLAARHWGLGRRAIAALSLAPLLLGSLSPQHQPSFEELRPLPADSPFAGLWAPPPAAAAIARDWALLPPLLADRRVLWLAPYGPLSAFGGRQVPGVAGFYQSTHARAHEVRFFALWQADPPEIVVQKPFVPIQDSYWAEEERLQRWLEANFHRVLALPDLVVWQLGPPP
mgnify:CR=1 FL=1